MAPPPPPSILVLGAGELGQAMLNALVAQSAKLEANIGTAIAVLLRPATIESKDETKRLHVASLKTQGIDIVAGDVVQDSPTHLSSVFRKYHTIINATGMYAPAGTQTKICSAILASGCRRYFPWQFGVDYDVIGSNSSQDLFTEQLKVRGMLLAQVDLKWVIVSTGKFTSFLFEPAFGLVNQNRDTVTAIGSWENSITVTSPADIGRVIAEIALTATDVEGVVYTAGDTVSMQKLADIVERISDKEIKRDLKTLPELREELAAQPANGMAKYRVVFAEGVGVAWDTAKTFNAQRGMRLESAEQWARENLGKA